MVVVSAPAGPTDSALVRRCARKGFEVIRDYPLTKANRIRLARAFRYVPHVDLSIDCAIEGQMGKAFVDNLQEPSVFKIQVGPFFYFAGDATGPGGRAMLENLLPFTLFMPSSPGWIEAGKRMYGERLVGFDRFSFSAEHVSTEHLDHLCQISAFREDVRRMDLPFAAQIWGKDHFVDLSDFDSADDFVQRGVGFYLEKHGTVAGAAYSSLVCSLGIEIRLFVLEEYRREGSPLSWPAACSNGAWRTIRRLTGMPRTWIRASWLRS